MNRIGVLAVIPGVAQDIHWTAELTPLFTKRRIGAFDDVSVKDGWLGRSRDHLESAHERVVRTS